MPSPIFEPRSSSTAFSPRALRDCFGHFATGVTVVSYEARGCTLGLTVNAFASVSLEPALLLVSIDRKTRAARGLAGRPFCVNILAFEQHPLALAFGGKAAADGIEWVRAGTTPRIADCLAWIECEPWATHDAGDHILYLGRICEFGSRPGAPLCFYRGRFSGLQPHDDTAGASP